MIPGVFVSLPSVRAVLQYLAMRRCLLALIVLAGAFSIPAHSDSSDLQQLLRNQYQGKTRLLRGFLIGQHLYYDPSGAPIGNDTQGDWTTDGFITIDYVQIHRQTLTFGASRLIVTSVDHTFRLRPSEQRLPGGERLSPITVEMTVDLGADAPSLSAISALTSKILLGVDDSLGDLVPAYWKSCVRLGLMGGNTQCRFSPELLSIPGVLPLREDSPGVPSDVNNSSIPVQTLHVGRGVSPPRASYSPEPEFSEAARAIKFQGTVALGLVVNSNGAATNIRILAPLGAGLDAKAVHAVENWRFKPAEKDGQPVSVEIAVEVNFQLF